MCEICSKLAIKTQERLQWRRSGVFIVNFEQCLHIVLQLRCTSKSEPAKHLKENPTHKFRRTIISKAPENFRKRRVLEAYFIKTICSALNEQLDNDIFTLFRDGITQI